jgi:CCR4-NOT transcription complex subunit 3
MNRKLATDIDRALKDVTKGIEQFDDIYKKVIEADTAGKKDKAESELKTQIKKLQRTRDQIKGWIASEEIREKDALMQARRTIETRMELFKRAEKEAKTKAFSKEGLAQADKLDPEEQARQECMEWVNDALEQIREQKEAVGADLEALQSKKGKKNKEELDDIQEKLKRHTWHVYNLELVLRGLDNDVLDYHDVDALKDEVEYYVTSNGEPDYLDDDTIYESLDLEAKLGVLGKEVVGEVASAAGAAVVATAGAGVEDAATKEKAAKVKRKLEQDAADEAAKAEALERKTKQDQLLKQQQERQRLINEREEARKRREQMKKESEESTGQAPSSPQATPSSPQLSMPPAKATAASIVAAGSASTESNQPLFDPVPSVAPPSSAAAIVAKASSLPAPLPSLALERQKSLEAAAPSQPTAASIVAGIATTNAYGGSAVTSSGQTTAPALVIPSSTATAQQPQQKPPEPMPTSVPSAPIPLPWPPMDVSQRLAVFDASLAFLPKEVDSERSKMYVPQNPFADAPPQFPVTPAPRFENSQVFERMDVDSLFFVFFHQPGTYQQFLAAKELKKHDWRYHKQHNVWIQRHEDPTMVTNDFEMGTFVYFDQATWGHRIKPNFTVEYNKLEI